jgi:hypothetical protein
VTTIAYRDGIMAGDTLVADEEVRFPCHERKVHRLRDGSLIGLCGDLAQTQAFMGWLRRGMPGECPPFDKSDAMIVRPDRVLIFCEGGRFSTLSGVPYVALGSGRLLALGCLWHGGTAVEAVRAGIAHDIASGGKVHTVRLRR